MSYCHRCFADSCECEHDVCPHCGNAPCYCLYDDQESDLPIIPQEEEPPEHEEGEASDGD